MILSGSYYSQIQDKYVENKHLTLGEYVSMCDERRTTL
jgi:hypothetical protein